MWAFQNDETTDRKCTNISSLFFCAGFVVLMFILVGYSATYANMNRLTKGYDDCGNICGMKNDGNPFDQCGDHDKQSFPKVLVETETRKRGNETISISHFQCVKACPTRYIEVFNRCYKLEGNGTDGEEIDFKGVFQEISQDLMITWPYIALVCLIAFVFSYILLILFRYAIKYVIWIIYISFILITAAAAIAFAVMGVLPLAIIFGILAVVSIILLIVFRNRIRLVAQLFKEASKALIDVPSIMFEPILTFISLILAIAPFVYFAIVIETSGKLTDGKAEDGKFQATFEHDAGMNIARFINLIAFIWFTQFVFGCQHFVIAGTISKWYFTRDKTKLSSPISTTFSHLLRFHLGSVCLGSMIITLVKIIKMIISAIKNQLDDTSSPVARFFACFCEWIVEQLDQLLQYLIRNAYIIVAKDGTPFFESGKKAFNLIFRNLVDVIALNNFGDIVLVLGRLFVVAISGFIGYELMKQPGVNYVFVPLAISVVFAYFIAHCFVSVFEMTVDTIFICFCEDCEENDGETRPYFMSPDLMKVMSELKETAGGQFNFGNLNNSGVEGGQQNHNVPIMPQPPYPTHNYSN